MEAITKVYEVFNEDGQLVYVGKTKNSIEKRRSQTKYNCKNGLKTDQYHQYYLDELIEGRDLTYKLVKEGPDSEMTKLEAKLIREYRNQIYNTQTWSNPTFTYHHGQDMKEYLSRIIKAQKNS